jgi:hypothetical protein
MLTKTSSIICGLSLEGEAEVESSGQNLKGPVEGCSGFPSLAMLPPGCVSLALFLHPQRKKFPDTS